MTSAKQIKANQENAQHSSGPTSAAGLKKAALNAISHGLTAQAIILAEREVEPFRLFGEGIINDLAPIGTYEATLVTTIIDARWRIHQIASMEAALYAVGFRTLAHEFEDEAPEHAAGMCRLITFEESAKRSTAFTAMNRGLCAKSPRRRSFSLKPKPPAKLRKRRTTKRYLTSARAKMQKTSWEMGPFCQTQIRTFNRSPKSRHRLCDKPNLPPLASRSLTRQQPEHRKCARCLLNPPRIDSLVTL